MSKHEPGVYGMHITVRTIQVPYMMPVHVEPQPVT